MATFGQLKLTNLGIQAQYAAQNGTPLTFTKIGVGSGTFSGDVLTLTSLVKEEVLVDITKAYMQDGAFVVSGSFSNENLQTSFEWREIGLYFEDEDGNNVLYCYANAGNAYDYIPATADERYTKTVRIVTAISNADNVSIAESAALNTFNTLWCSTNSSVIDASSSASAIVYVSDNIVTINGYFSKAYFTADAPMFYIPEAARPIEVKTGIMKCEKSDGTILVQMIYADANGHIYQSFNSDGTDTGWSGEFFIQYAM